MPETNLKSSLHDQLLSLVDLLRWIPVTLLVGLMAGTASAALLASLTWATDTREAHHWLIALLPLAGLGVGLLYRYFGTSVERGNNLILEQVHQPSKVIPVRMTPLVLLGTFASHLFGASAGREGTAIQTGASLADQLTQPLRMVPVDRRILLMCGISAGFASVFGTPMAGAIFGMEVLAIGAVSYEAIAPCLFAAFFADMVTRAWAHVVPGIHHATYTVVDVPVMRPATMLYAAVAGMVFGVTAMVFAQLTHGIASVCKRITPRSEWRPFAGGIVVVAAVFAMGTTRYIGLGLPTIAASFTERLPVHDFLAKLLFTSVTLGAGFKGGEVTPLFFIGSTLGNALSHLLPLSPSLLAGMGFVAVFAGAANTPIASIFMAMELFGSEAAAYAGIACILSYLFSGHAGIYAAQQVPRKKFGIWQRRTKSQDVTAQEDAGDFL